MTPKEKAKEIISKYFKLLTTNSSYVPVKKDGGLSFHLFKERAKKCALIAVDEIINLLFGKDLNGTIPESITDYWYEVKSEIEQL